jgi:hypothetical protein
MASLIRESVIASRLRYCNRTMHAFAVMQSPPRLDGASAIAESVSIVMTCGMLVGQSTNGTLLAPTVYKEVHRHEDCHAHVCDSRFAAV